MFERALQIDPNDAEALTRSAETYASMEQRVGRPRDDYDVKIFAQANRAINPAPDDSGCTSQRPDIWACRAAPVKPSRRRRRAGSIR